MPNVLPFDRASFNSSVAMCDTSFIGNLVGVNANSTIYQECQDTLLSMMVGKTTAAVTVLTGLELQNMYLRNAYRGIFSGTAFTQEDIKQLKMRDPSLYEQKSNEAAVTANQALQTVLGTRPFWDELLPLRAESYDLACQLQQKYQFPGFADALQLASAIHEGARYFLTTDKDFCGINEPNIQVLVDRRTFEKNVQV